MPPAANLTAELGELPDADDAEYNESSDEEFNPTTAAAADDDDDEDMSSSSEDDDGEQQTKAKKTDKRKKTKRKRKAEDAGLLWDSGDEKVVRGRKRGKVKGRGKGKGKSGAGRGDKDGEEEEEEDDNGELYVDDDGSGGEGGWVKTRAQRRGEQVERRALASTDGATVDVEALWQQMMAAPVVPVPSAPVEQKLDKGKAVVGVGGGDTEAQTQGDKDADEDFVAITRSYNFAGQDTTEEKSVLRSALDEFLADGWKVVQKDGEGAAVDDDSEKVRRPLRRPSRFDPNPSGQVRGLAPEFQLTWPRKLLSAVGQENATGTNTNAATPTPSLVIPRLNDKTKKLNVVIKSKHDWTGFVEKEGLKDELEEAGKSKKAYLGREDFLKQVEMREVAERRRARGLPV